MKLHWTTKAFNELTLLELYAVLRLRVDVFVVEQQCPYAEVDGQDIDGIHLLCTQPDGTIVAYARVIPPHADGLPHIGRIVVHQDHRAKGLATELMQRALEVVHHRFGTERSALAAQCYLEAFYNRFGFLRTGPDYVWDGIPHVDMQRLATNN